MLDPSISVSSENANITRLPKNARSNQPGGLKKRSKALNDVKNTIHSHSSHAGENKSKNVGKNVKKDGKLSSVGKMKKSCESKIGFNIFEAKNDVENKSPSDFECYNHFACEKANSFNDADFLAEYKLNEEEINYLGDRMRFFQLDSVPMKTLSVKKMEPVEDMEVTHIRRNWSDDIEADVTSFDIPQPFLLM